MSELQQTVFIVDDDDAFRDSLEVLFESVGIENRGFASANEFLAAGVETGGGCLVLDIRMPGMSGLDLQAELNRRGARLPILFMTGHGDVPMAVRAMKAGAMDFLTKPFSHQELLDRVQAALKSEADDRERATEAGELSKRHARLTPREGEVFELVVAGLANKVIANRLGISQRTVEIHRAQVMAKMKAGSLAELVRMAIEIEREGPSSTTENPRAR